MTPYKLTKVRSANRDREAVDYVELDISVVTVLRAVGQRTLDRDSGDVLRQTPSTLIHLRPLAPHRAWGSDSCK